MKRFEWPCRTAQVAGVTFSIELDGLWSTAKKREGRGMRAALTILLLVSALAAWPARTQTQADEAVAPYLAELAQRCPGKNLQWLSPSQLRDGLDDYISSLSSEATGRLRQAERAQCSSLDAGVACVNGADIGVLNRMGLTTEFADDICLSFTRCRGQSDCDAIR
ncbi:MAG: hypothetical protein ACHP84_06305 [Caulobacterales bacterium]